MFVFVCYSIRSTNMNIDDIIRMPKFISTFNLVMIPKVKRFNRDVEFNFALAEPRSNSFF